MTSEGPRRRVVLVTGLSGAGKASILHVLEDLGFETIDNLPLSLIGEIVARETRPLAIGVDARTRGFAADALIDRMAELRATGLVQPELVYATASHEALQRRYTETRRRHPLAPRGRVSDGIDAEAALLEGLPELADLLIDTSDLPPAMLRRLVEARFTSDVGTGALTVALVSFAYPLGLPREADLVFDARFLRNPHYVPELRRLTGLDPAVGAYIEQDDDYAGFFRKIGELLDLLLPRFVHEGKRYVTIGIGCTGGRHRSVHIVERLTTRLALAEWRVTRTHRELARDFAAPAPISEGHDISVSLADQTLSPSGQAASAREA